MSTLNTARYSRRTFKSIRSARSSQSGLSLVELLIAATISLVIVASLAALFSDMSRSNQELAKTNSQIENARFAIQILENDLVHAGYWSGHIPEFDDLATTAAPASVPTDPPPDPCKSYATWNAADEERILGVPVQVYRDSDLSEIDDCVPGIIIPTGSMRNLEPDTDILITRHAETCSPGEANCDADVAGRLYMQVSNCENQIGLWYPEAYALEDDPNSFPMQELDCIPGNPAAKRRFIQNIYFIRNFAVTQGDGIPTLARSEFDFFGGNLQQLDAEPLVEGIERIRVELGIDDKSETGDDVDYTKDPGWYPPGTDERVTSQWRGDGYPDEFRHCPTDACTVSDHLVNAVVARVYILARAVEETPGYTDTKTYNLGTEVVGPLGGSFKRHVFSTTVRLSNVAGRRETPWDPNAP
jgi:type IV pilus assembly protein PilW